MEERAPSLLLIATMLVPLLSGCVAVGFLDEPATAPDWEAGYSWVHERSGHAEVEVTRDGETVEEIDRDMDPLTINRTVVNTTLEAGGEPAYVLTKRIEQDGVGATLIEAVRQRDLAPVPLGISVSTTCTAEGCHADSSTGLGDPPEWTFLDFPLVPGKTWTIDPPEPDDEVDFEITAEVGSPTTADLPIGPTEIIPVTFTAEPTNLEEKLDEARQQMEDHGARIDRLDAEIDAELEIGWSQTHQTPAVIERRGRAEAVIAGTTEDGESLDRTLRVSGTSRDELVSASLVAGPEKAPGEVDTDGPGSMLHPPQASMSMGVSNVDDAPREASGGIRIVADDHRPNAASGDEVEFAVRGADSDSTVRWSILHPDGGELASGQGTSFEHTVTDPGQHLVRAELIDGEGDVADRDDLSILARWSQETEISCDVVATAYVGGCDPVEFPVASGVDELLVDVRPDGMRAGFDEVRLLDADGEVVARSDGQDYTIMKDDFEEAAVDGSPWTVEYDATASSFNSPDVTIEARYDEAMRSGQSAASAGSAAWPSPLTGLLDDAVAWGDLLGPGDASAAGAVLR